MAQASLSPDWTKSPHASQDFNHVWLILGSGTSFSLLPVFVMFLVAIEKNISQFVGTVILMGKGWLQKK